jgi:hypothetical protein
VAGRGGDGEAEIPDPAMERAIESRAAIRVPRGLVVCVVSLRRPNATSESANSRLERAARSHALATAAQPER